MAEPQPQDQTRKAAATAANDNRPPLRVISSSDRSNLREPVRNVSVEDRKSTMPGSAHRKINPDGPRDIATQFNETYPEAGLQPANKSEPDATRNVRRESNEASRRYQKQASAGKRASAYVKAPRPRKFKGKRVISGVTHYKSTAANTFIWSWSTYLWLVFQIPLAVISIMTLAITQALHYWYLNLQQTESGNWFVKGVAGLVDRVFSNVFSILDAISELIFGIDLDFLNPATLFMITYLVLLVICWLNLLIIYFTYKLLFLEPLGGKGANLKMGMFMLAFIGYAIPIANLFPWFMLWTLAVRAYPE